VILISGDFVRTGGMDMSNYRLADFLARNNLPVHIVSHNVDPSLLSYTNVVWHRVPRPFASSLLGEHLLRWRGQRLFASETFTNALTVVNGGNCPLPGVNWVHYVHAAARPQQHLSWLRKLKTQVANRMFLADEARAFRRARLIIANSERTKGDLIMYYGLPADRIHVVYYGSDPQLSYAANSEERQILRVRLGLSQEKFLVLFVGALGDRRKGFDTLFDAWQATGKEFQESSELIVVGRGAELALWQRRAARFREGRSIHFLGFRRDVPQILRACDAFVAPARYEAFGLAVQEAVSCGLPAIVSRHAGVAELFPDTLDRLLLDDCESVLGLAATLQLLRDRYAYFLENAGRLGDCLRSYTWDHMAQSIYTKLTAMS